MTTLLAADVGNTNVVLGVYDGAKLISTWRTATRQDQTEDELAVMVDALLGREDLALDDVDAFVLGSVVPPLTASFTRLAERYLDRPALVIGPGVKTGVRLRVDNPSEVGADRIANTLAAQRRFEVSAESLFGRASRLFRVPLTPPPNAIGKNTADCLRSGIVFGYVGLVEGLLARLIAELGVTPPHVLATGGLAVTIAPLTKGIERVDEDLTLEGLRLLWELNA